MICPVIRRLNPEEWYKFSEGAHALAFNEHRPRETERITFALLAVDERIETIVYGYMTCIEMDAKAIYMQHGGAFQGIKNSIHVPRIHKLFLDFLKQNYKYLSTSIENTNFPMLKLAMKNGLKIIGIRQYNDKILLEHMWKGD